MKPGDVVVFKWNAMIGVVIRQRQQNSKLWGVQFSENCEYPGFAFESDLIVIGELR